MQPEQPQEPLKESFFFPLNGEDLLVSAICALLIVAISLFMRAFSDCFYLSTPVFIKGISFLAQFPTTFFSLYFYSLGVTIFGSFGSLLSQLLIYIVSFIFKLIMFYYLELYTRKNAARKGLFLSHHLFSILVCAILSGFTFFYFFTFC
jgi:hypothetical protein